MSLYVIPEMSEPSLQDPDVSMQNIQMNHFLVAVELSLFSLKPETSHRLRPFMIGRQRQRVDNKPFTALSMLSNRKRTIKVGKLLQGRTSVYKRGLPTRQLLLATIPKTDSIHIRADFQVRLPQATSQINGKKQKLQIRYLLAMSKRGSRGKGRGKGAKAAAAAAAAAAADGNTEAAQNAIAAASSPSSPTSSNIKKTGTGYNLFGTKGAEENKNPNSADSPGMAAQKQEEEEAEKKEAEEKRRADEERAEKEAREKAERERQEAEEKKRDEERKAEEQRKAEERQQAEEKEKAQREEQETREKEAREQAEREREEAEEKSRAEEQKAEEKRKAEEKERAERDHIEARERAAKEKAEQERKEADEKKRAEEKRAEEKRAEENKAAEKKRADQEKANREKEARERAAKEKAEKARREAQEKKKAEEKKRAEEKKATEEKKTEETMPPLRELPVVLEDCSVYTKPAGDTYDTHRRALTDFLDQVRERSQERSRRREKGETKPMPPLGHDEWEAFKAAENWVSEDPQPDRRAGRLEAQRILAERLSEPLRRRGAGLAGVDDWPIVIPEDWPQKETDTASTQGRSWITAVWRGLLPSENPFWGIFLLTVIILLLWPWIDQTYWYWIFGKNT